MCSAAKLEKGDIFRLLDRGPMRKKLLPAMLAAAQKLAAERMTAVIADAVRVMDAQLQDEIERLETLRTINDHVRPEEIAAAQKQKADMQAALATARLRLDAVRLIWRMP